MIPLEYLRLLRPSVLEQLAPRIVELVNELPELDEQDKEIVGQLFVQGGLAHAQEGPDGVMSIEVKVRTGHMMWEPSVIVMPHAGDLEVELVNPSQYSPHAAVLPSNGSRQFVLLPMGARGKARLSLDGPGYYWFGCPIANHVGRGMLGLILVGGNVPESARLDRPPQPRPGGG